MSTSTNNNIIAVRGYQYQPGILGLNTQGLTRGQKVGAVVNGIFEALKNAFKLLGNLVFYRTTNNFTGKSAAEQVKDISVNTLFLKGDVSTEGPRYVSNDGEAVPVKKPMSRNERLHNQLIYPQASNRK